VIVFLQENKTTDFYFPTLGSWGAAVADHGNLLAAPPNFDQPHDRSAWVHYAAGDYAALLVQIDNDAVIPFYSFLAKRFTFCDHHFGLGSNSTSGHMLAIGGETPTLKNPPFVGAHPTWNIPSIFSLAQSAGVSWAAFPDGRQRIPDQAVRVAERPGRDRGHSSAEPVHSDGQSRHVAADLLCVEPGRVR
jgi:phospholipase C